MADYKNVGNRWTCIFVRKPQAGGSDLYERVPFDLCRFNVDTDPDALPVIVPIGENVKESGVKIDCQKQYEKIWIVDTVPWRPGAGGSQYFGNIPE